MRCVHARVADLSPNVCAVFQVMALEMLILLLENPSDDSVEMAVDFCKEVSGLKAAAAATAPAVVAAAAEKHSSSQFTFCQTCGVQGGSQQVASIL